jgi:Protein of unknown function (DUF4038)/Putative collagen-binding domain of a collagenase
MQRRRIHSRSVFGYAILLLAVLANAAVDGDRFATMPLHAAPTAVAFPLQASANGHYLVDSNGAPFRIQGDASWDAHINLNLDELRAYLDDRRNKGFNALFTYTTDPVAYYAGSSAPWAKQLGGAAAGVAALPFTANVSGGAWNGDPGFSNHDASFAAPNDAYFAWLAQFIDEANARGMVVMLVPMYLGYGLGSNDGWYRTLTQPANTQAVCFAFGQYLANGHGAFTGLKNRANIIWIEGGDTLPPNGSEAAMRALQILKGMQAAGDTHLQTSHWQHDYLPADQTDFAPYFTAQTVYSHGPYPTPGPTYIVGRLLYASMPARPTWLIETNYWGDHGASRAQLRYFSWGAALSAIGGVTFGFGPFWGFATSPDGSTGTASGGISTAWRATTFFDRNSYVSKSGSWYRAINGGNTGSTGPSGMGSAIVDGSVQWTYVGTGGISALFNEPGVTDFALMGAFLDGLPWHQLVPSALGGMANLIAANGGSYGTWSSGGSANGGMDWVVSAATPDGRLLLAYVPDAHTGAFSVTMSALSGNARARWFDPSAGAYTAIGNFNNTGTQSFTPPPGNASGEHDWVLVLDVSDPNQIFANGFEP